MVDIITNDVMLMSSQMVHNDVVTNDVMMMSLSLQMRVGIHSGKVVAGIVGVPHASLLSLWQHGQHR